MLPNTMCIKFKPNMFPCESKLEHGVCCEWLSATTTQNYMYLFLNRGHFVFSKVNDCGGPSQNSLAPNFNRLQMYIQRLFPESLRKSCPVTHDIFY